MLETPEDDIALNFHVSTVVTARWLLSTYLNRLKNEFDVFVKSSQIEYIPVEWVESQKLRIAMLERDIARMDEHALD
jgi:hypothetical protein